MERTNLFLILNNLSDSVTVLVGTTDLYAELCKLYPQKNIIYTEKVKVSKLLIHSSMEYTDLTLDKYISPTSVVAVV